MTIYQIEAFRTLAATLSYTKAANLIHTTQPNLSKLIASMEQELGIQLLERSRRDVNLTPAGEAFLKGAENILIEYEAATTSARETAAGISGTIKVGFLSTALIHHLPRIVNTFREQCPKITLELYDYTYSPLMSALLAGKIDVALTPDRELESIPRLEKRFLYADDMCLVLPRSHPLGAGDVVELAAFADKPFVMMDPNVSDRDYDLVYSICMANGFYPKVSQVVNTLNNLLLMVECGIGVSILARHMEHFATDKLDFIGIKGWEKGFKMVCAWHRDKNPCVPQLLDVIDECFA